MLPTTVRAQEFAGTYPMALAQSADGKHLFVADASLNAVCVLGTPRLLSGSELRTVQEGFIPTDWYPSALAVHGDDLLIATAKGQGTRPNKGPGKTAWEVRHREHPYIPTLLRGSIARLNIPSTLGKLDELTRVVEHDNLLDRDPLSMDPGTIQFAGGKNPIKHVIYVIKENRTYDQILGDLKSGDTGRRWRPFTHHVRRRHHAERAQAGPAIRRARQFLRQRRSFRRRTSLVHRRHHQRLQRKNLADRLPRQRAHL